MSLDTAKCLNPENGTPFRAEPPCVGRCRDYPRPPGNTVLWAVSSNSRDSSCFKLDKQTWRRKSNGSQKTISQNLLIKKFVIFGRIFTSIVILIMRTLK